MVQHTVAAAYQQGYVKDPALFVLKICLLQMVPHQMMLQESTETSSAVAKLE